MSGLFGATAAAASTSNTVGDLKQDVALSAPPEDTITCLSFSPATNQPNDFLAVSSWDKKIRIYEVTGNGQSEGRHAYSHDGPVFMCDFSKVRNAIHPSSSAIHGPSRPSESSRPENNQADVAVASFLLHRMVPR